MILKSKGYYDIVIHGERGMSLPLYKEENE